MKEKLLSMPANPTAAVFIRDSEGTRWEVRRVSLSTWQIIAGWRDIIASLDYVTEVLS
jgi:hypothetical protein